MVGLALAPSTATAADGGNWWYDKFGVAAVAAQGFTGAGVKIAVIGGQINPTLAVFGGTGLTVAPEAVCGGAVISAAATTATDGAVQGSDMAAIVLGNGEGNGAVRGIAPAAAVTFYGFGSSATCPPDAAGLNGFGRAVKRAVADGARIITTSVAVRDASESDIAEIAAAQAAGVIMVAAIPDAMSTAAIYPAVLNGVVSVNAFNQAGVIQADARETPTLDIWPETTVVAPGVDVASTFWGTPSLVSGASYAAPMVAAILAVTWQKFPAATANELIQSLIHNTTLEDHPLQRDTTGGYGYGPASLRHMLAVDPATYPDVNPLMDKASGRPTLAQVATALERRSSPSPSASVSPGPESDVKSSVAAGGAMIGVGIVSGAIGLVVLIAIVGVVLRRRTTTKSDGGAR